MIIDEYGNEITTANLRIPPGGEKFFTLTIEARTGFFVRADPPTDITIFAKAETGDAFQNIETSPLDLSAFDGSEKIVYFKVTAAADIDLRNDLAQITVAP